MLISELAGRDVGILGIGVEGEASWRQLRQRLPEQPLTLYTEADRSPPEWLAQNQGPIDRLVVGPLNGEALARHEVLIRSPGISPYREALSKARASGVRFTSASSLWFAEHPSAHTIVITGTKGKSTTTALVRHLLEACGVRAVAAGNIGRSLLDCEAKEADWWVIELSSYQICDLEARPSLAALLNLSDEHLDWHRGAANYRRDKLRLAELVPPGSLLVNQSDELLRETLLARPGLSSEAARRIIWFGCETGFHQLGGKVWRGDRCLLEQSPLTLPGKHNLANLAAALAIVDRVLGGAPERLLADLPKVLADFRGLPHRLQRLGCRHGLHWYDDSLATTPVATLAALEALAGRPVTVLVGGLDRGLDWRALAARFRTLAPHAVLGMPDSGRAVIDALRAGGLAPPAGLRVTASLAEAVERAVDVTPEGGVVLLSPGAPSFPQFRDFRERGERFAQLAGFGSGRPRPQLNQP